MPRPGLTETKLLDETKQMADETGLSQLTLAALAARLGVSQPSLYKHVDGTAALRRGLAIRAKRLTRGLITALASWTDRTRLAMRACTGVNLRSEKERS